MKKYYTLLLLVLALLQIHAQTSLSADTMARIEKLLARYQPSNPGIQVSISRNGILLFSKAYGSADLEHNVPLTTRSILEAGSVSKQFTSAAILLLVQEGKLSLEDDIRKYIPEIKDYGLPIPIRTLMQHTSGIKDWGSIAGIAGWPRSTKTYSNADALYIIQHQKTLNNQPGDEFIYSNSNYNLLAILVQRLSGKSLADFSREKLFQPAGMQHTEWRADFRKVVPGRAIAYSKELNAYLQNMPNEYVYGNGGLLTTTEDLLRWNDYYSSGKLGGASLLQKQTTSSLFTNGLPHHYGAGLFLEKYNGLELWTHSGATAGYRANLDYFPALGLSIAWLSNTAEFDGASFSLTNELRAIFIPGNNTAVKKTPAIFKLDKEKLSSYSGWFRNSRTGAGMNLILTDTVLLLANSSLRAWPVSERIFSLGNSQLSFMPGYRRFYSINPSGDSVLFVRAETASLTSTAMREYTGNFYSGETESSFIVRMKNDRLVLIQEPSGEFELTATYKDGFDSPIGVVFFERDKQHKIVGMKISVARARNVQFDKMK